MSDSQRIEASRVNSQSFFGSHAAIVSTNATMSATQVRAADCGEQRRIRLRRDDAAKARINGHVQLLAIFGKG